MSTVVAGGLVNGVGDLACSVPCAAETTREHGYQGRWQQQTPEDMAVLHEALVQALMEEVAAAPQLTEGIDTELWCDLMAALWCENCGRRLA